MLNLAQLKVFFWGQITNLFLYSVTWWYCFVFQCQVGSLGLNPFTAWEGVDLFRELLNHSKLYWSMQNLFLTLLGQWTIASLGAGACGTCLGGRYPGLQSVRRLMALYLDTILELLHLLQAFIDQLQLNCIPGSGGVSLAPWPQVWHLYSNLSPTYNTGMIWVIYPNIQVPAWLVWIICTLCLWQSFFCWRHSVVPADLYRLIIKVFWYMSRLWRKKWEYFCSR